MIFLFPKEDEKTWEESLINKCVESVFETLGIEIEKSQIVEPFVENKIPLIQKMKNIIPKKPMDQRLYWPLFNIGWYR